MNIKISPRDINVLFFVDFRPNRLVILLQTEIARGDLQR